MTLFHYKNYLQLTLGILLTSTALGADVAEAGTAVPEPSIAILGGLCGLLFLIWRRK